MKAIKILAAVCLAGLLFTACNGNEDNKEGENQEITNTVVYNGQSYNITAAMGAKLDNGELGPDVPLYRFSFYIGGDNIHCFPRIAASAKGKTIDLSKHEPNIPYTFDINDNDLAIDVHQSNDKDEIFGIIDRGSRQDNPIFKSGSTMKIDEKDGDIVFVMNAVTISDKELKVSLKFTPVSEF